MNLTSSTIFFVALAGYLIGSVPFAYIITRRRTGIDLRERGSKNIGAMNAYEVTGKKNIGRTVLALDMLKGAIPVIVFELLHWNEAILVLLPALILGHCYPVWLRFRGGRGLATAAGSVVLVNPVAVLLWALGYVIAFSIKRQTHFAAIVTTGICIALLLFLDDAMIAATTLPLSGLAGHAPDLAISLLLVLVIILSRYRGPFLELIRGSASSRID